VPAQGYYSGSNSFVPAYPQMPQYAQQQALNANSIYGQQAQYGHSAPHPGQGRMGAYGGQGGKQYGGYPFGGSPYGAAAGNVNASLSMPSSQQQYAGMPGGYPADAMQQQLYQGMGGAYPADPMQQQLYPTMGGGWSC
jgi:hypothetical protein